MKSIVTIAYLAALSLGTAQSGFALARTPPTLSVPRTPTTPKLDADPADPAWKDAAAIPALGLCLGDQQKDLHPLATQVKLLWSEDALYVRFLCDDDQQYIPNHGHDSPIWKGDAVEVFLDVKGDARQWIELEVSPSNDTFDQLATLTAEPRSDADGLLESEVSQRDWWTDLSWDLDGWRTAARIDAHGGWIVDMAIPASALRRLGRNKYAPLTMRANFIRYKYLPAPAGEARRLLAMDWAPVVYGCPHLSPQAMGYLQLQTK
ncbi:hypothetical protein CCAX7_25310 [Capsulimonas corticalis]|uniref:Uncharacterized protein n=1 Tax=Capsulimonas corticalis TaxID=2219043 RepID=A0A402CVP2_9BACT|nr:carbohydrate-binding family 9-like protein [Capsulimonas corticalis]BDI30480.1 hypothetical protein CCAX7_25310 [Capsulimonas corticalis]